MTVMEMENQVPSYFRVSDSILNLRCLWDFSLGTSKINLEFEFGQIRSA